MNDSKTECQVNNSRASSEKTLASLTEERKDSGQRVEKTSSHSAAVQGMAAAEGSSVIQDPDRRETEPVSSYEGASALPNWLDAWSHEELEEMQCENACISELRALRKEDKKLSREELLAYSQDFFDIYGQWNSLTVIQNLLYHKSS